MLKTAFLATALAALTAGGAIAQEMMTETYKVTVTNNLDEELLAPILITNVANDAHIFDGAYVTPEAEEQILTGDPAKLAMRIGEDAMVGHGSDGPPGVLLAPGKSVSFEIKTDATAVRVIAMIAPTMKTDHYVSNVVDLHAAAMAGVTLNRFDIGHDEGTKMNMAVADGVAEVSFEKM